MAEILNLRVFGDERGKLSVLDGPALPFTVKRYFLLHSLQEGAVRGAHLHKKTRLLLSCVKGRCSVEVKSSDLTEVFHLDTPDRALLVEIGEWHRLFDFNGDSVILALASEEYDPSDYYQ